MIRFYVVAALVVVVSICVAVVAVVVGDYGAGDPIIVGSATAGTGALAAAAKEYRASAVARSSEAVKSISSKSYKPKEDSDDEKIVLDISEKGHDKALSDWKRDRPGRES